MKNGTRRSTLDCRRKSIRAIINLLLAAVPPLDNRVTRRAHSIMVSSIIRCSVYILTVYAGFNGTYARYDPTARPSTPSNGSSVPSGLPLPKKSSSSATLTNKKWVSKKTSKHTDITAVIPAMQSAVRKLRARSDTDPLPDPSTLLANGLYFTNADSAVRANRITYWQSPSNDQSVPTKQVEVESWIHRLVNAISNNIDCVKTNLDKDSKGWMVRWANGATFYRKTAIEALAWKLLVSVL